MASFDNLEIARLLWILMKSWPTVIAQGGNVCQASEHVHFGQCERGLADTLGLSGNRGSQFGKQAALDLDDLFLGIEDLRFVLFQFGSCEALGIDQRLFAF